MNDEKYWTDLIAKSASRYFLLASLAREPLHGYGLAREIAGACNNCCTPTDAMIYPAIREMSEAGLITCRREKQGKRTRNVCELTEAGWEAYRIASEAWARVLPGLRKAVKAGQAHTKRG
jgi:DNA-binding PadR family transcriptional regulator